jgi:hypothetical protein
MLVSQMLQTKGLGPDAPIDEVFFNIKQEHLGVPDELLAKLCAAAPHVDRFCLQALAMAYGIPLIYTSEICRNGKFLIETYQIMQLLEAARVFGLVEALIHTNKKSGDSEAFMKEAISRLAIAGADARHAPNRARKATWEAWHKANKDRFKSKDQEAEVLSGKASVTFRTAREWITEWSRKQS